MTQHTASRLSHRLTFLILILAIVLNLFFLWDMAVTNNNRLNKLEQHPVSMDFSNANYINMEVYDHQGYVITAPEGEE